jgi:hypothetical protein
MAGPAVIPQLQYILPLGPTSLSVQWTVPAPPQEAEDSDIEGYFIYFRESESAAPYNKITIFGRGTHSHVIENLRPETQYDVKVGGAARGGRHAADVKEKGEVLN